MPSSDHPQRPPGGQVPPWFADEDAALVAPRPSRRTAAPAPPPRSGLRGRTWALLGALGVGLTAAVWSAAGMPGLGGPDVVMQEPPAAAPTAAPSGMPDPSVPPAEPTPDPDPGSPSAPSREAVELADAAHLSAEGRRLFFAADPQVLGSQEFQGRCDHGARLVPADGVPSLRAEGLARVRADTTAVGCFRRDGSGTSIVLYRPADARLHGFVVEAAAHETLHAAWEELDRGTRETLTGLMEAVVARFPADHALHQQIAGSVGDRPQNRPTELFAYVGTQVWDGGLHPDLEAVYRRYVDDRAALVAVHTSWRGLLDGLDAEIRTEADALTARETDVAQRRAQLTADSGSLDHYRQAYAEKRAEVAAMTPEQRAGLSLGWTWWDGTELPMQDAEALLATAADLLARDEAALATREATLATDEAAAAQQRATIETQIADLQMLHAQLDPRSAH